MKIVISDPKSGKSFQSELPKEREAQLVGKKIGDTIEGDLVGAAGYKLELTGGSDSSGFPMKRGISGARRVFSLTTDGTGFHANKKGERKRKMIKGYTYSSETMQINTFISSPPLSPF